MSVTEQQPNQDNNDIEAGQVKHPLRIFLAAIFIFLIPIGALILILEYATNEMRQGGSPRELTHEAVAERIQPVARVTIDVVEETTDLKTGEEVYNMTCATCHADGVAGAPKFGNEGEWAPYIETGYDELLEVALHGRGAMPAKGGNASLDDLEVERAMVYMANASGADFDEPSEDGADDAKDSTQAAAEEADDKGSTEVAAAEKAEESADTKAQGLADEKADKSEEQEAAGDATPAASANGDEFAATDEQLEVGKKLYEASCAACHAAGVAGAPLFGSAEQWQPYIETGLDEMLKVAIEGKGAMPPRGASTASDEELEAAILYMVSEAKE